MAKMSVKKLPSRKQASAGPRKYMADGGTIDGPSHEAGGVEAQDPSGKPVAEVEGGERLFSTEDTAQIEQTCQQIIQLQQSNPKSADQLAKELGYAICEMIAKQEQNEQAQSAGVGPDQDAAANSFETPPQS